MSDQKTYTTRLGAGLGLVEETKGLLQLWQPGFKAKQLYSLALESGNFPNVSARRLRNIVAECFAPRYLVSNDYPACLLKSLEGNISSSILRQLLLLFTARANQVLYDFISSVYWGRYAAGHSIITNEDSREFVIDANENGRTSRPWSESMIKRVSSYLLGCSADFGLLESGRKRNRKIIPFRMEQLAFVFLAYDLHFQGLGDNSLVNHPDWQLYGLQPPDVRDELKRLAKKGFFIIQTAGDSVHIGWQYTNWEELIDVIATI